MTNVANIVLIGLAFLIYTPGSVSGVVFLDKPQNITLESSLEPFTLKCRVDVPSPHGMDWTFEIDGEKYDICTSVNSEIYNCTRPGYAAERPNNRTMNLIVLFRNTSVTGKYCCNPDDSQGIPACAYITVTDVSTFPHSDRTEASKPTTATASVATSAYLLSTPSSGSSQGGIGIVVGVVVASIIGLVITVFICYRCPGCPIYRKLHDRNNGNGGTARENKKMMTEKITTQENNSGHPS